MGRQNEPLMRVGGIAALAMSLRRMGDEELSREMKAASKAAAEKIVPFSKEMVPVNTGALRDTIKADATRRYGRINAGTPTRVPYAIWVHRGHYDAKAGKRYPGTKFLSKAIPKAWPQIIDEYVSAMNRIAKAFEKKHGVARVFGGFK